MTDTKSLLVGYFGKLPQRGDFIHFNMNYHFKKKLDEWIQSGMTLLREKYKDTWTPRFIHGSSWRYIYHSPIISDTTFAGVLIPSVDQSGRYFPFSIVASIACKYTSPSLLESLIAELEKIALIALQEEITIEELEAWLATLYQNCDTSNPLVVQSVDRILIRINRIEDFQSILGEYFYSQTFTSTSCFSAWWTTGNTPMSDLNLFREWPTPEFFTELYML